MRSHLLDPCGFIRVQAWSSESFETQEVESVLETPWPKVNGTIASGKADVLCVGPTDWLVVSDGPNVEVLHQQLEETFAGSTLRATNVSQALARIELEGPDVRALLLKGCSLDLSPSRFPPGRCARTRFASLPVVLRCTALTNFECIVASSYCDYLLSWLADAAEEFLD